MDLVQKGATASPPATPSQPGLLASTLDFVHTRIDITCERAAHRARDWHRL